jgi:hypothetical protein
MVMAARIFVSKFRRVSTAFMSGSLPYNRFVIDINT